MFQDILVDSKNHRLAELAIMTISLTGFMGCGKSSVGKKLSELLCCRFIDLDSAIEEHMGCSVADIFSKYGEDEFRRIEKETLKRIVARTTDNEDGALVLALGGGAIMNPECEGIVHSETFCIYLRASVDTLLTHLNGQASARPLLSGIRDSGCHDEQESLYNLRKQILELMTQRSATYERTAHLVIDTDDKSIEEISDELIMGINSFFNLPCILKAGSLDNA